MKNLLWPCDEPTVLAAVLSEDDRPHDLFIYRAVGASGEPGPWVLSVVLHETLRLELQSPSLGLFHALGAEIARVATAPDEKS